MPSASLFGPTRASRRRGSCGPSLLLSSAKRAAPGRAAPGPPKHQLSSNLLSPFDRKISSPPVTYSDVRAPFDAKPKKRKHVPRASRRSGPGAREEGDRYNRTRERERERVDHRSQAAVRSRSRTSTHPASVSQAPPSANAPCRTQPEPSGSFSYRPRLRRLHEAVHANIDQRLSVTWAASVVHVAPKYFSAWFSRSAGVNYVTWLTLCRLNHAELLWRENNSSVLDMADKVGFGCVRSFERACLKCFTCTPKELRARARRRT